MYIALSNDTPPNVNKIDLDIGWKQNSPAFYHCPLCHHNKSLAENCQFQLGWDQCLAFRLKNTSRQLHISRSLFVLQVISCTSFAFSWPWIDQMFVCFEVKGQWLCFYVRKRIECEPDWLLSRWSSFSLLALLGSVLETRLGFEPTLCNGCKSKVKISDQIIRGFLNLSRPDLSLSVIVPESLLAETA